MISSLTRISASTRTDSTSVNYTFSKEIDWLKSLKDRILPQPKQEWSALDERNLQGVIDEIQANKNNAPDYDLETYDRFLNWLKSLRPQNRWKPSDEQIKALKDACDEHWEPDGLDSLYTLYQDLKKLKGE